MKTIREFLADLRRQQVTLWVEGDQLRLKAPKGVLTESLVEQIREHKADILTFLGRDMQQGERPAIDVMPRTEGALLPLSYAQQRLWFLDQLEGPSPTYNVPIAYRLTGTLQIPALEQAINTIIDRHEVLRTTFSTVDGQPVQRIASHLTLSLPVIDLQHLAGSEQAAELDCLLAEEAKQPFDLAQGPLLRVTLYQFSGTEQILLLNMHHIISDAWSLGIWWRELDSLYGVLSAGQPWSLPELPLQYADFAQWQRSWLTGDILERQLAYWQEQLVASPILLELPTDRPRPSVQSFHGRVEWFEIEPSTVAHLRTLSRRNGASLFMTLYGAFAALLSRYSGQEDIVIGSPIANRHYQEIEPLIGFFVNTLALRADLSGNPTFVELLKRVRQMTLDAYAHQDMPFEQLVIELEIERNLSHSPLFQVMFAWQDLPQPSTLGGLQVAPVDLTRVVASFDLTWALGEMAPEAGGGLQGMVEYNTDLFERATICRMIGHFQQLLSGMIDNPDQAVRQLPLLTEAERHQLLVEWNETGTLDASEFCLHHVFEQQVERTPDAIAVVFGHRQLTYRGLNRQANQLAHHLRTLGGGPDVLVGLYVERSVEMVVGLLAILKAGGAYVPLDPSYPGERLSYMLCDAKVQVLLTQEGLLGDLSVPARTVTLVMDAMAERLSSQSRENPSCGSGPQNLAYVIYTSGSTGTPKGVMVTHRNLVNAYLAWEDAYQLRVAATSHLQMASFSFDVFSGDVVRALCSGGKLVLCPQDLLLAPKELYALMQREQVDCAEFVPAVLRHLLDFLEATEQSLDFMRLLIVGSDLWHMGEYQKSLDASGPETRHINSYGTTEATIDSSYFERAFEDVLADASSSGLVPIGRPFPNTQLYVLDAHLQPVPVGIPGELYVGGTGLARGYFNHGELTAERFVPSPFMSHQPGARLYKTGDRARYLPDGNIEYINRTDTQVKLRGFRIELGEIETRLTQHDDVRESVVIAHEVAEGQQVLIAYLVPMGEPSPAIAELRQHLSEKLPDYMIPSVFVPLQAFPLTPNGKVDRRALPIPEQIRVETVFEPPYTPTEDVLAAVWAEVLRLDRVSRHDNFFELGGHSLLATQVVSRVREAFQIEVPVRTVFEAPTIAKLGQALETAQQGEHPLPLPPPMQPVPREGDLPLSFAQQRLWFLDQFEGSSATYNTLEAFNLRGRLDIPALEKALHALIRRHEVLRTTFPSQGGQPLQQIHPELSLPFSVLDLRHLAEPEQIAEVNRLLAQDAGQPFDLVHGPLLRVALYVRGDTEYVLLVNMHHIISDVWSMGVWWRELDALYQSAVSEPDSPASASLPELPLQYADFAQWQRTWLTGEVLERQLAYWEQHLADAPVRLELPTDHTRSLVQTFRGDMERFELAPPLRADLRALSRRCGASLFMTLYGAFAVLMSRYTGQDDLVIGTPIANRHYRDIEPLIGFFLNTLALRTDLSGDPGFVDLLAQVRQVTLDAYAHQDIPFEQLVDELAVERNLSHSPLFQVLFVWQDLPQPVALGEMQMVPLDLTTVTSKFDLTFFLGEAEPEAGGGLRGLVEYNTDLFERATICRMIGHFQQLLHGILDNPDQAVRQLPLLTEAERLQLLVEWNDTETLDSSDLCLHHMFEQQVARTPDAIAVVFEQHQLTYRELNRRANRLAHHLLALGVGPDVLVGLYVERSLEMVVGLLAILKAGGAYVPLDPAYPEERLSYMLADARVQVLLTQEGLCSGLSVPAETITLAPDAMAERLSQQSRENPSSSAGPQNLLYVIYTSGSTGRPKGVAMRHQPLANLVRWQLAQANGASPARTLQFTPLSFDVSCQEIFTTWCAGGTLVLITDEIRQDGDALLAYLNAQRIEQLFLPFIALQHLAESVTYQSPPEALRDVITAGEQLHITPAIAHWFSQSDCRLHNHYGPTESHVASAYSLTGAVSDWPATPPIGQPVANTQLYILDRVYQPVPVGVTGELYLGGECLARGYLHRPDLTAERFILNPFEAGRLYKTGDLARYRADGQIEFLGRADDQVKLRGFRIELGEIEAVLAQHPDVRETAVVVREDEGHPKQLVAYVVPHEAPPSFIRDLRDHLSNTVPDYMVPAAFVLLDTFPLTPSGKVDRRALPAPQQTGLEGGYEAPLNPIEELLAAIWCEVLGLTQIGRHDNFFDLGGHSLLATQVISRIRDTFEVALPVRTVFESASIAKLALALETARQTEHPVPVPPPIRAVARKGDVPLSFAQQRLWFLDRMIGPSAAYNFTGAFRVHGLLDVKVLEPALNEIVRRHEVFRTTFPSVNGEPVQRIAPGTTLPLVVVDLQAPERRAELNHLVSHEMAQPFDLARGPLLRVILYQLDEREQVVLVNMHHIISDGWSMRVWWCELDILYRAFVVGDPSPLPELALQYADFSEWQRGWLSGQTLEQQLAYWRQQLADAPTLLELPTDHPRPTVQSFNGAVACFEIEASKVSQLRGLSRSCGVSLFMTLYGALAVLMSRYSGQEDLVIGSPIANRHYQEIEPLIGFFVNTLPLRVDLSGGPTFTELLVRVRQITLEAHTYQDVPFEQLVVEVEVERNLSHPPLFQVVLAWQELFPESATLGDLPVTLMEELDLAPAKFDLVLYLDQPQSEDGERLRGQFEYNTDLFERATITRMISHFEQLLDGIIADPEQGVHTLPLLTQAERHQLLDTRNATQTTYSRTLCAHQLIEAQAQLRPMAQAVLHPPPGPNASLTYGALNQRANQLAHYLRKLGVGPEVIVAVYLDRSLDMIISLLAILKAGGAYTPIDPGYPPERVKFILDDTQTPVLLTQTNLAEPLVDAQVEVICVDRDWPVVAQESRANPVNVITPDNMAYLIYTSGSTGRPKGVQVTHGSLLNLIFWLHRLYDMTDADRIPSCSGLSFDVSVYDIWPCLTAGATLCLSVPDVLFSPLQLQDWLITNRITKGFVVTALAERLLSLEWPPDTPLQLMVTGGEKSHRVPAPHHPFQYYNAYGPAENTVITTCGLVPPNEKTDTIPSIGRPMDNVQVHILDRQLQLVPTGIYGDLCIGGDNLTRGYLRRPGLTAERFLPNPFSPNPGARMYTTGDLVRYLPNGEIEFAGRMDHQIKIRGFRIELGEIESVLASHAQVQAATVLAWDMGSSQSDKRLVAYLVLDPEQPPTAEALRDYLKAHLPEYMVPAVFVPLEAMPLTPNGKVDRRALPSPDDIQPILNEHYVSPQTALEKTIAEVWQEVLSVEKVGIHDNFFDIGGHSLSAIRIQTGLQTALAEDIPITDLFRYATVASLAEHLSQKQPEPSSWESSQTRSQARRAAMQQRLDRQRGRAHS
ncbi:MAG: hypothetical protein ETSY1_00110 [Candidatus Entotheonella factor]|uniref:Carrier domain-containing protein n=1 Tax=Entotheonella factor TaxID=1429438 RepID=W4LZS5_ENTF1|nr:MAG: hypothetical protein ETSY1_00110 [Candidatus Entotheonella factor]